MPWVEVVGNIGQSVESLTALVRDRDSEELTANCQHLRKAHQDVVQVGLGGGLSGVWVAGLGRRVAGWLSGMRVSAGDGITGMLTVGALAGGSKHRPSCRVQAREAHATDSRNPVHPLRIVHDIQVDTGKGRVWGRGEREAPLTLPRCPIAAKGQLWQRMLLTGLLPTSTTHTHAPKRTSPPHCFGPSCPYNAEHVPPAWRRPCWTARTAPSSPSTATWAATTSTSPATCTCTSRARRVCRALLNRRATPSCAVVPSTAASLAGVSPRGASHAYAAALLAPSAPPQAGLHLQRPADHGRQHAVGNLSCPRRPRPWQVGFW